MSLIEFLDRHGVAHAGSEHHHVRDGWVGVDCPLCSPTARAFRLGFELNGQRRVSCWHCGGQNGVSLLHDITDAPFSEIYKALESSDQEDLQEWRRKKAQRTEPEKKFRRPAGLELMLPAHEVYLKNRGFDPEYLADVWGITHCWGPFAPEKERMWRIYIPIHDADGREVSWTSRSIKSKIKLRYLSASEEEEAFPHKKLLYGAHLAQDSIGVVEGPLDAWALGRGGVGTLGVGYTVAQFALMTSYVNRVVCFDSSEQAQQRAKKLCSELSLYEGTTSRVELEAGDDAAECLQYAPEEIEEFRSTFF